MSKKQTEKSAISKFKKIDKKKQEYVYSNIEEGIKSMGAKVNKGTLNAFMAGLLFGQELNPMEHSAFIIGATVMREELNKKK